MAIKYKQLKNEEDITRKVSAKIDALDKGILIYLRDETETAIGFFSKKGFYPMLGTEKKYRIVTVETLGDKPRFPTWFKVFRKWEEGSNGE